MDHNNETRTKGIVAAACLLVIIFALSYGDIAEASIADKIKGFFSPLFGRSTSTQENQNVGSEPVPLYQPALDYEKAVVEAVKKASPAVVSITVSKNVPIIEQCPSSLDTIPPEFRGLFGEDFQFLVPCQKGTRLEKVGGGSGFIIQGDGLVLTNKHVVNDEKASYTVFTNDGNKYDATVLARDPVQDLAVLKIDASNLPTVVLGDSNSLSLGQSAIAIGNALGEFRNTVSVGVISGLARTVTATGGNVSETIHNLIQTDAAINPGNSGGPLLNLRGEVIGINTAIAADAQNIGFAIPINRAKRDIASVKATGVIQSPYLGVRYIVVNEIIAQQEKLAFDYGVLVRGGEGGPAIMEGSPAAQAGLKDEDIILAVNGAQINKDASLAELISEREVGETVRLKVIRAGAEIEISAVLSQRPE